MENEQGFVSNVAGGRDGDKRIDFKGIIEAIGKPHLDTNMNACKPCLYNLTRKAHF